MPGSIQAGEGLSEHFVPETLFEDSWLLEAISPQINFKKECDIKMRLTMLSMTGGVTVHTGDVEPWKVTVFKSMSDHGRWLTVFVGGDYVSRGNSVKEVLSKWSHRRYLVSLLSL